MPDLLRTYTIIAPSALVLPQATSNGALPIQDHVESCGDDHYDVQWWHICGIPSGFQLDFTPTISENSNRNANIQRFPFKDIIY